MRPIQIESWALNVIQRVEAGQPNEDYRVELKADWIDDKKAARQIAGHANSSRGTPILWLIGVDQDSGVVGVSHEELADWYAKVASEFDGVAPQMIDLNIPYQGQTVVALFFETDRAPYVVKNPAYGVERGVSISFEIPWREGTRTRTAQRSDLLRLLVPILSLPEIETLEGMLTLKRADKHFWGLRVDLYITPQGESPVVIPFHRCEVEVRLPNLDTPIILENIKITPPYRFGSGVSSSPWGGASEPDSYTVANTQNEVILQGPGRVKLSCEVWAEEAPSNLEGLEAEINLKFLPIHANNAVLITESLTWTNPEERNEIARWVYQSR